MTVLYLAQQTKFICETWRALDNKPQKPHNINFKHNFKYNVQKWIVNLAINYYIINSN